ncbi:hypothetical protein FQN49_000793 [Arthroderma sp. PD_2]|nr:hypothetical protein FQN49_000793 [Arthroderma sp. PD_2]
MGEAPDSPPERDIPAAIRAIIRGILHQWLLIAMGISCALAYRFPDFAKIHGTIRAEYTILYGAVAIVFLVSGLSIPRQKLVKHMLNWRLHILVQGISYLIVPAIMTGLIQLVHASDSNKRFDIAVLAGYIFVGCLPTTISSNVVMTRAAGGDEAAALVEVLIANIMGPFVTPGWTVALLPKSTEFDPWRHSGANLTSMYRTVFKALGLTVLVPLVVGQIIRWVYPEPTARIVQKFYLAKVSSFCLVLLVWTSFSTCFATHALESLKTETIIFTVFFNIGLYTFLTGICFFLAYPPKFLSERPALRYIFCRLPPGEVIAICFCGAAKTSGLGIPLLYAMYETESLFQTAQTSVAVVLYTTEQIFCAHFMVHLFRRWGTKAAGKKADEEDSSVTSASPSSTQITSDGVDRDNEKRYGGQIRPVTPTVQEK